MPTFQQVRDGVTHAWDTITEGWRQLYRRAASAITRFSPRQERDGVISRENREITARSSGWGILAAEVFDDDKQVVVRLEAPGMEREDFDLEVMDDVLIIRGEKRVTQEHEEGRYHVLECAYGSFERAIQLPAEVEPDKARARYRKGVLRIELPKIVAQQRHNIKVTVK